MAKIDDLDLKILREFQRDARQSYREMAEKLKVAEGTIYNRVGKLKELGIIKGFLPNLDYSKLGYDLVALIGVVVEGGHLPELEQNLSKERNVSAVYDITGDYDAIVVAKFKNRSELNDLVKKILGMKHVSRTYTMVALNVVKEEHGVNL